MSAPSERGAVAVDRSQMADGSARGIFPVRIFQSSGKDDDVCVAFTDGQKSLVIGFQGDQFYVLVDGVEVFETGGARTLLTGAGFNAWQVNPHLVPIADGAFSIGNYTERIHNLYIAGNLKGAREVDLVESAATQVYAIVIPAGERCGGYFHYSIHASDGTDHQLFTGRVPFSAVNKGGTITVAMTPSAPDQSNDGNAGVATAGGMAYAITTTTTATEARFHITALTTLVQTVLRAEVRLDLLRPQLTSPE